MQLLYLLALVPAAVVALLIGVAYERRVDVRHLYGTTSHLAVGETAIVRVIGLITGVLSLHEICSVIGAML